MSSLEKESLPKKDSLENSNSSKKSNRKDLETKTISLRICLLIKQSKKISLISHIVNIHKEAKFSKRMSRCISARSMRGSITIEAAVAFPMFLFFMLNMISMISVFHVHSRVEAALHQTGRKMAVYAYAAEHIADTTGIESTALSSVMLSTGYVKQEIVNYIGEDYLDRSPIVNGRKGISLMQSAIMEEDDMIDLVAVYKVKPAFAMMGFGEFSVVNRCRMHAWTGYDNTDTSAQAEGSDAEIVYITENGTVYHRDRNCTHVNLSIHMAEYGQIETMRNLYGSKYILCELCDPVTGGMVYITEQGNRYHTNPACSGLKRTVSAVSITEAGGRSPCIRCGQ